MRTLHLTTDTANEVPFALLGKCFNPIVGLYGMAEVLPRTLDETQGTVGMLIQANYLRTT
jgi:hypothetical protein